ncbi:MAG: DUF2807 domain-containing protein [Planctomycetota bacterium]
MNRPLFLAIVLGFTLGAIVACTSTEARYGPGWMFPTQQRGSGVFDSLQREFDGEAFERFEVDGSLEVAFAVDSSLSRTVVTVEGDDDLIGKVRIEDRGTMLFIAPLSGDLRPVAGLRVLVRAPRSVQAAILRGSGELVLEGFEGGRLAMDLYGSGDLVARGRVDELSVRLHGSGSVQLAELESSRSEVELMGSGEVQIVARQQLVADVRGSGEVGVVGDPEDWSWDVFGSGQVHFWDSGSAAAIEASATRE